MKVHSGGVGASGVVSYFLGRVMVKFINQVPVH